MKFVVEINLGNAAMETTEDVALALKKIIIKIENRGEITNLSAVENIRDINGNRVGFFGITEDD